MGNDAHARTCCRASSPARSLVVPAAPRWRACSPTRASPAPQTPDLAIICTPAPLVPRLVESSANAARAVMVMANQLDTTLGADGRRPIERSIPEITRRYEMRLLGGGTLASGTRTRLNATFSQIAARPASSASS